MPEPSAAARAAMRGRRSREPDGDSLERLRLRSQRVRTLDMEISSLEERVSEKKSEREKIVKKELPDMLAELKMNSFDLDPVGNEPAYTVRSMPYYHANIASDWEEPRRQAAFDLLARMGAPDMLKTIITIELGRGTSKVVRQIASFMKKLKVGCTVSRGVPYPTLTAWVRELYEHNDSLTQEQKEILGATVGTIAVIKPKKERK